VAHAPALRLEPQLLTSLKRSALDGVDRCCCCFAYPSNLPKTLSTTVLSFSLSFVSLSLFLPFSLPQSKTQVRTIEGIFLFSLQALPSFFIISDSPSALNVWACMLGLDLKEKKDVKRKFISANGTLFFLHI